MKSLVKNALKKPAELLDTAIYRAQLCLAWALFRVLGMQHIDDMAGTSLKSTAAEVGPKPVARGQLAP